LGDTVHATKRRPTARQRRTLSCGRSWDIAEVVCFLNVSESTVRDLERDRFAPAIAGAFAGQLDRCLDEKDERGIADCRPPIGELPNTALKVDDPLPAGASGRRRRRTLMRASDPVVGAKRDGLVRRVLAVLEPLLLDATLDALEPEGRP
jgi:hypothetical protein